MRQHGYIATYNVGCRCSACREASRQQSERRRARTQPERVRRFTHGRPELEDPMRWADSGLCRTMPLDVFFPKAGGAGQYDLAKSVCASCDVQVECLAYALRTEQPAGCWGGLAPEERWRLVDRTA